MSKTEIVLAAIAVTGVIVAVVDYTKSTPRPPLALSTVERPDLPEYPIEPAQPAPRREPRSAIHAVLLDPDAYSRAIRLATLLPTLGADDLPDIIAAAKAPDLDLGGAEVALLTERWATFDPKGAIRWAFAQSPLGFRATAIVPAVSTAAKQDPQIAIDQIYELGGLMGPNGEAAGIALIRGWFASGHPGLVDYIFDLGGGVPQQRALHVFLREAVQRDGPEAVERFVEGLPDEPENFKLAAFRQAASEIAKADPASAIAWCEAQCGGRFGGNMRELISARWAATDGPAAMEWLSTAPEGKERDRAVRATYRAWYRNDEAAVERWMLERGGLEAVEPWLYPAVDLFAVPLSQEDPAEALRWAALMPEEDRREKVMVVIARRWRAMDEAAAEAWVQQSSLSEEARERARAPLEE